EEQQELAYEAEHVARRIIAEHRAKLEEIAGLLLEREVLERDEIDAIMRGVPRLERRPGESGLQVAATARHEPPAPSA
ncbi:MAG: Peptidase family, partial [Solirubrobacteraceae bacterium]|nr:Peptidase family [Solirubrobacteraceae bacterium]